jgi:hypothetical protein
MATKEHKRQARQAIEGLELRVNCGPPIGGTELQVVREFLGENDFSPASDYYCRLELIQERLQARAQSPASARAKGNYGGESAGRFLQVQSVFDHIIISTCYEGDFNTQHGRIKISHRFNQEGRIDFVELKFLRALQPWLTGEIRKLLLIRDYQALRKDWHEAGAFVLPVLPRELVFLYPDLFRCPRSELLAWLINIGHGIILDLVNDLASPPATGTGNHLLPTISTHRTALLSRRDLAPNRMRTNGAAARSGQAPLDEVVLDEIAWPILNSIASLTCVVESIDPQNVQVSYQG